MNASTDPARIGRRGLLHRAAALGVAGPVLAACGSGDGATSSTATSPEAESPGSDTPSSGGNQSALAASADVPVGGGVVVDAEKVVITQPTDGEYKAFTAVCTHQGCIVASVEDNEISCPCHGSKFSAEDGSVVTGPATAPLSEVAVQVQGGNVVRS